MSNNKRFRTTSSRSKANQLSGANAPAVQQAPASELSMQRSDDELKVESSAPSAEVQALSLALEQLQKAQPVSEEAKRALAALVRRWNVESGGSPADAGTTPALLT